MDVFTWSLPFVGEKVTQVLVNLLNICSDDELGDDDESVEDLTDAYREAVNSDRLQELEDSKNKKIALKKKIMAVAKMAAYFHNLREEQEAILQLKGLSPNGMIPEGILDEGRVPSSASKTSVVKGKIIGTGFSNAKILDKANERLPTMRNKK